MEEVLFETESMQSRSEIAAYLREIADRLDGSGEVTFAAGAQSQTLQVPARPTFEVKVERETSKGSSPAELSVELELEWNEGEADDDDGSLEIG